MEVKIEEEGVSMEVKKKGGAGAIRGIQREREREGLMSSLRSSQSESGREGRREEPGGGRAQKGVFYVPLQHQCETRPEERHDWADRKPQTQRGGEEEDGR